MTATDVQKILNLKHAWEFILDRDVIASRSDYYILSHTERLVNEGFLRWWPYPGHPGYHKWFFLYSATTE